MLELRFKRGETIEEGPGEAGLQAEEPTHAEAKGRNELGLFQGQNKRSACLEGMEHLCWF